MCAQTARRSEAESLWKQALAISPRFLEAQMNLADSFQQLVDKICTVEMAAPKVKGSRVSTKPSPEFLQLLSGMLTKDPEKR